MDTHHPAQSGDLVARIDRPIVTDPPGKHDAPHSPRTARPLSAPFATSGSFFSLMTPPYVLGAVIIALMVAAAGFWNVLADTRLLSVLLSGGIVALGEDDSGFGGGVPGVHYFIRSQEPIAWQILLLSAALFVTVALLKGLQFHRIARHLGIEGGFGSHLRAYIYGNGMGRMLPYRMGEVAWASALEAQGDADLERSARLVHIFKGFLIFEIATFAVIGLVMSGLLNWALALIPPFVILAVSAALLPSSESGAMGLRAKFRAWNDAFADLAREPHMLAGLVMLSIVSFGMVELATYFVPQAFSTLAVPLVQDVLRYVVVTPPVIVMAVVAGYIARLVPVTPGGIGQFELAFAAVLVINNLPVSEAVVLTLLASAVRYGTGALLFGATILTFGIETNFHRVRDLFCRAPAASPAE